MPHHTIKPHSKSLRIGRYSEAGRIYVVTTLTANRKPLFTNLQLGRIMVNCMRHHHDHERVISLAFVVMPDHLHWLVQLNPHLSLSKLMQSLKSWTAREINSLQKSRQQPVWQPGYHDRALRKETDIKTVARYIVANPLRAGLVTSIMQYPLWDAIWL